MLVASSKIRNEAGLKKGAYTQMTTITTTTNKRNDAPSEAPKPQYSLPTQNPASVALPETAALPAISPSIEVRNLDGRTFAVTADQLTALLKEQRTSPRSFAATLEGGVAYLTNNDRRTEQLVLRADGFIYQATADSSAPIARLVSVSDKLVFVPPNLESYQYSQSTAARWIDNGLKQVGTWLRQTLGIPSSDVDHPVIGWCEFITSEASVPAYAYYQVAGKLMPKQVRCSCALLGNGQLEVTKEGKGPSGLSTIITSDGYSGYRRAFGDYIYPLWPYRLQGASFECNSN